MDKKTILVIDDSPSNLLLLNNLLSKDYRVKVANGGYRGLQLALADDAPDLILLDVVMPELNGFEVCDVLMGVGEAERGPGGEPRMMLAKAMQRRGILSPGREQQIASTLALLLQTGPGGQILDRCCCCGHDDLLRDGPSSAIRVRRGGRLYRRHR